MEIKINDKIRLNTEASANINNTNITTTTLPTVGGLTTSSTYIRRT